MSYMVAKMQLMGSLHGDLGLANTGIKDVLDSHRFEAVQGYRYSFSITIACWRGVLAETEVLGVKLLPHPVKYSYMYFSKNPM